MHESLLAKDTLDLILEEAEKNKASKVLKAKIKISDTENLSIESFKFHLYNFAKGTIAEGMELEISFIQIPIICNDCGHKFYTDTHIYVCERCGSQNTQLGADEGITIEYIDIDIEEA
ncbi:MAG: hydrogenase maturation nickel metallochaperone HypA, partial [Brevinematia bacterium]